MDVNYVGAYICRKVALSEKVDRSSMNKPAAMLKRTSGELLMTEESEFKDVETRRRTYAIHRTRLYILRIPYAVSHTPYFRAHGREIFPSSA